MTNILVKRHKCSSGVARGVLRKWQDGADTLKITAIEMRIQAPLVCTVYRIKNEITHFRPTKINKLFCSVHCCSLQAIPPSWPVFARLVLASIQMGLRHRGWLMAMPSTRLVGLFLLPLWVDGGACACARHTLRQVFSNYAVAAKKTKYISVSSFRFPV